MTATLPAARAPDPFDLEALGDYRLDNLVFHPTQPRVLGVLDLAALGIPDEAEYRRRYGQRTGLSDAEHWNFYLAYNLFRKARPLAELAWEFARGA